jgi:hypothetical protein
MSFKVKVPVTNWHEIDITDKDMIEMLEQEERDLAGSWDCIIPRNNGTAYYYNRGYGSHDIGKKNGPDVPSDVLEKYHTINNAIKYFRNKVKEASPVNKV